jgi:hypothetical protein
LFAPAGCRVTLLPPPPLKVPAHYHLASHCTTLLFAPLIVVSPLVVTLPLNVLAGCTLPIVVPPSHLNQLVVALPLIATTIAHHDRAALPPSIALLPPSLSFESNCA